MATDDDRRKMARILRDSHDFVIDSYGRFWSNGTLFGMRFVAWEEKTIRDGLSRIADFIEPAPTISDTTATHTDASATRDTSQSCRDNVACDPTERGIDSIHEWCRERLEGADGAEDYMLCTIMSAIEEFRHPERVTASTARPVDREALLALAYEMCDNAFRGKVSEGWTAQIVLRICGFADRIRVACGVSRDE